MTRKRKWVVIIIVGLVVANVLAWPEVFRLSRSSLEVIFFDVGQGDASLIKTSQGHLILIDGGPDSVVLEKLAKEIPFWDKTIDLIVLTHPHYDHISGLNHVLAKYKVENILWTGVLTETVAFREWQELINSEKGVKEYLAQTGQKISAGPISLEILYPFKSLFGEKIKELDNTSLVLRLVFKDNSFLFTGDAFVVVEKELIEKGVQVDSDVLQVGHHGSNTSTDETFLENVSPSVAVISVGKENSYGHPHEKTLNLLKKHDIVFFRTDINEDIKIVSDGRNLKLPDFGR
jgi:competence protein ComEC